MIWYIILALLAILFLWFYYKYFKIFKTNALCMITGGVKTGKSTLGVYMAVKHWRKRCRKVKILNIIRFILRKPKLPYPLLYSNIPLNVPYVPMTEDLLLRNERFVYGSVCYLGEISLISNSMNFKDVLQNERQLLFYKLFGHETRGGLCIIDTQSIADCHYSIKRSISEYLYIHHSIKLPFFVLMAVQENIYSDDNSAVQVNEGDLEKNLRYLLVPKRVWKLFDAYCYSYLTDNCPVDTSVDNDGIKANFEVVSFNQYKTIYDNCEVKKNVKKKIL